MSILIKDVIIRNHRVSDATVWRHLVVHADGHTGFGEFTLQTWAPEADAEARSVARSLIGLPLEPSVPARLEDLRDRDIRGAAIVSAVDQAVNDVLARITGMPLAAYLGGVKVGRQIGLYANINRRTSDRSPSGFRRSASDAIAAGFSAIKIAPFDGLRPELCQTANDGTALLHEGLARIAAVREVLPTGVPILVDCHWRLSAQTCHSILPELERLGVTWLECPLPETAENIDDIVSIRHRANSLGLRLAGCEMMTLWRGFRPFVEAGAYDVIMPDIKYVGGFEAMREVAEEAARYDATLSLHNPSGPICHLHSLHACAALGLTERLELQFAESPLFSTLVDPNPPSWEGGKSRIPENPGIGCSLVAEADFSGSDRRTRSGVPNQL